MSIAVSPDARLARLAARQHALFTFDQALACGYSPSTIYRRLESGLWRRVHRGVFAVAAAPATTMQRYFATTLASPRAVLSGRAAAHVHRLDGCRAVRPEITVPASGSTRVAGVRVRRRSQVQSTVVDGLPSRPCRRRWPISVPAVPSPNCSRSSTTS